MEPMDRLLDQMDRHGIDRLALIANPVEPFRLGPIAHRVSGWMRQALRSRWAAVGRIMYRTTVTPGGKFSALGKTYRIIDRPDNAPVARALSQHPQRFYGWVFVNPRVRDGLAELEAYGAQPGWVGVKAHPFWHRYPVRMLDRVAAWCAEREKPLLIHLGGDRERGDYRWLHERHPRLKVLYAHAGVPWYQELWAYIASRKNAWVDLSSPYLDEPLRRAAVRELGPERCVYGSDGPFEYPDPADGGYDHGAILTEIARMDLSDAARARILSDNFRELTGV